MRSYRKSAMEQRLQRPPGCWNIDTLREDFKPKSEVVWLVLVQMSSHNIITSSSALMMSRVKSFILMWIRFTKCFRSVRQWLTHFTIHIVLGCLWLVLMLLQVWSKIPKNRINLQERFFKYSLVLCMEITVCSYYYVCSSSYTGASHWSPEASHLQTGRLTSEMTGLSCVSGLLQTSILPIVVLTVWKQTVTRPPRVGKSENWRVRPSTVSPLNRGHSHTPIRQLNKNKRESRATCCGCATSLQQIVAWGKSDSDEHSWFRGKRLGVQHHDTGVLMLRERRMTETLLLSFQSNKDILCKLEYISVDAFIFDI